MLADPARRRRVARIYSGRSRSYVPGSDQGHHSDAGYERTGKDGGRGDPGGAGGEVSG